LLLAIPQGFSGDPLPGPDGVHSRSGRWILPQLWAGWGEQES